MTKLDVFGTMKPSEATVVHSRFQLGRWQQGGLTPTSMPRDSTHTHVCVVLRECSCPLTSPSSPDTD